MADKTRFIITLEPTNDCTDPLKALRELLKRALRSWGLRCTGLRYGHNTDVAELIPHKRDNSSEFSDTTQAPEGLIS